MKIFKDAAGRTWILKLDLDAREKIKERLTIGTNGSESPLDLLDATIAHYIAAANIKHSTIIIQLLWVLCEDQSGKAGIDEAAFCRDMKGAAWGAACSALRAEVVEFFPEPSRDMKQDDAEPPATAADIERSAYKLAGMIGVDPGPMTLRKLAWMADGRQRENWNHTSHMLAWIHNSNPYRRDNVKPSDLNPTARPRNKKADMMLPLSMLSGLIVKNRENDLPGKPLEAGKLIGGGIKPIAAQIGEPLIGNMGP